MELVDTHCHLDHPRFEPDREAVLERAHQAGVGHIILPGVEPATFDGLWALAAKRGPVRLHVALGIHPQWLPEIPAQEDEALLRATEAACRNRPVVAVGECGLDYRLDLQAAPKERQRAVLLRHLRLARELSLPVLLHCLSAHEDLAQLVDDVGGLPAGGIMHSFSGSAEQMRPFLQRGFHISFAGPVSWLNARKAPIAASLCPPDRLLCETDAPDQAPEPVRGQRNEPAHLIHVLTALARVRGETLDHMAALTTGNARRVLRLP